MNTKAKLAFKLKDQGAFWSYPKKAMKNIPDEVLSYLIKSESEIKFEAMIKDVAENIDAGMVCYINTDTLEFEYVPNAILKGEYDDGEDTFQEIKRIF